MEDSNRELLLEPELDDVLDQLRDNIFSTLNCIQVGKIDSYSPSEQVATVQIQIKRPVTSSKTVTYPLLVDCPVIVMQGGGAYIEFPIEKGDYCLVFFNDQDIDTWWDGGQLADPNSDRRHDLSDGFVLVGINPKTSVIDLAGNALEIDGKGKDIVFNDGSDFMVRYNELKTAFDQLKQDLNTHIHTTTATVGATATFGTISPPTIPSNADISPAKISNIKVPAVGE